MSEHNEQCNLIDWAKRHESIYPALANLFAVPNGGLRDKRVGFKMKKEGLNAGVPDLFLACPSFGRENQNECGEVEGSVPCLGRNKLKGLRPEYFGLFIEMKYGKNKTTEQQDDWIRRLRHQGYKCVVCYSWEEARDVLEEYMDKFAIDVMQEEHNGIGKIISGFKE